jgi:hypothetical protein
MTFSRVLVSSAMLMGGLGSALLVRMGGLTRRGVVCPGPWAREEVESLSSLEFLIFKADSERWVCSDSFRGLLSGGMLDMRRGMDGGS